MLGKFHGVQADTTTWPFDACDDCVFLWTVKCSLHRFLRSYTEDLLRQDVAPPSRHIALYNLVFWQCIHQQLTQHRLLGPDEDATRHVDALRRRCPTTRHNLHTLAYSWRADQDPKDTSRTIDNSLRQLGKSHSTASKVPVSSGWSSVSSSRHLAHSAHRSAISQNRQLTAPESFPARLLHQARLSQILHPRQRPLRQRHSWPIVCRGRAAECVCVLGEKSTLVMMRCQVRTKDRDASSQRDALGGFGSSL